VGGAPTFYFDLGSPFAYLAAERLETVISVEPVWQPVLLGGLFKATGRSSWARGDDQRRAEGIAELQERAQRYELPPLRFAESWPDNYLVAMRAATYAFRAGAGREFAMSAFRFAFVDGADLSAPENVLEAARRAGMDPAGVERAVQDPEIKTELRDATDAAHALGVFGVPTIAVDGEVFWGDDRLEDASARLRG
jgi:2-hydroxychromene-2-carboxylate isomerase